MQIKPNQLPSSLSKNTAPVYFISGDEILLVEEAQQQIRQAAQERGYTHREIISISTANDWDELYHHHSDSDLFSMKKIIDIRNPKTKFDTKALRFFEHIKQNPNPDTILMISSAKLSASQKKTKWFKAIDQVGVIIPIWPISARELPTWIKNRCQQANVIITNESIQLLANLTEGNLLAAQQTITKLSLLFPQQKVGASQIASAVHDAARFNIFDLSNYALAGNITQTQRALEQLRLSGTEPTLILWSLCKEIRLLHDLLHKKEQGENFSNLLRSQWQSRQQLLNSAIKRLDAALLTHLLQHASLADRIIKGHGIGSVWRILSELALGLCGRTPITLGGLL